MKDTIANSKIEKGCTLGTIRSVSLFKLKNPDGVMIELADDNGKKITFDISADSVFCDIEELVLTLTLSKYNLLPNGMWVHNLDVEKVMQYCREKCTSYEKVIF